MPPIFSMQQLDTLSWMSVKIQMGETLLARNTGLTFRSAPARLLYAVFLQGGEHCYSNP